MRTWQPDISRRKLLRGTFAWLLAAGLGAPAFLRRKNALESADSSTSPSKILVAYFTRSGNTRVIADQLHRDLSADLFEIKPETPYPADYEANVEEARREKETGFLRPLKSKVPNWSEYERVFLGFPIWGGTAPAIIRSFLTEHDATGKLFIPFITHGKYGLGDSLSVVRAHTKGATLLKAYSEECDQERDTMEGVDRWLEQLAE